MPAVLVQLRGVQPSSNSHQGAACIPEPMWRRQAKQQGWGAEAKIGSTTRVGVVVHRLFEGSNNESTVRSPKQASGDAF